jgi:single-strand DNA-binding protein
MLNRAQIIGRVGKDPVVRYSASGDAVAGFSIATTEKYKDKQGQQQEKTEWHNIMAFRRLAEIIGEYVRKGSLLYVEGKIETRKYQDKTTGQDRYATSIIASEMKMLGGRPEQNTQQAEPELDDDIPF